MMTLVRSVTYPSGRSLTRLFASASFNTTNPYQVFDRRVKRHQRDVAASIDGGTRSVTVDYVRDEAAERLLERFVVRLPAFCIICELILYRT